MGSAFFQQNKTSPWIAGGREHGRTIYGVFTLFLIKQELMETTVERYKKIKDSLPIQRGNVKL
jgi:hypothetical protein